jgi:hypothetical protein
MVTDILPPNEKRCSKCKEVKDRGEFGKNKVYKDGLFSYCKQCYALHRKLHSKPLKHQMVSLRGEKQCRLCEQVKQKVDFPIDRAVKGGLKNSCKDCYNKLQNQRLAPKRLKNSNPDLLREIRSRASSKPNFKRRRGDIAEIKHKSITFPKEYWPQDCRYARVVIDKNKLQIEFNPVNKKTPNSKIVAPCTKGSIRLKINLHEEIASSLDIIARKIIYLRKGAGFAIQFLEEDLAMFDAFEIWAKSGLSFGMNREKLSVYNKTVSIAEHIWPSNAEYAFLEWHLSTRKNGNSYFDLIPVSRTGFIVAGTKNQFKQYIGLYDCLKLRKNYNRLFIYPEKFLNDNNIPFGDWDLKEILPSGALRFRLYKERNQLEEAS